MTENERFTVKPQDDLFAVVDNNSIDIVCVVNGIRTEIETEWLCDLLNELYDENEQLKSDVERQRDLKNTAIRQANWLNEQLEKEEKENEQLKKELQRMYDVATLNKAIEVLENKYDKMLSDGSDEVKDAMRHTVLRCIEDLDELKDDITAR